MEDTDLMVTHTYGGAAKTALVSRPNPMQEPPSSSTEMEHYSGSKYACALTSSVVNAFSVTYPPDEQFVLFLPPIDYHAVVSDA